MASAIPGNRARFTVAEICAATEGESNGAPDVRVDGIATDSREDLAGKLFVALTGEHFDGHRFVPDAVRQGASAVLVRAGTDVRASVPVIVVADTLSALGALARAHRRRWGGKLVAIAGSAGKTTTRSAIAALLEAVAPGAVHSVRGNLNNRVGAPMVLLGIRDAHRIAVVEVGTNTRGEVADIASIVEPDIGVLTLIDVEHAAGLGSLDDIEIEEGDLLRAVSPGGAAIANGEDERAVRQLRRSPAARRLTYGFGDQVDYRILDRGAARPRAPMRLERPAPSGSDVVEIPNPLLGAAGALAMAAAVAVADQCQGEPVASELLSRAAAAGVIGEPGRLTPLELADGTLVLDDTYNANPASVLASVAAAEELAQSRGARLVVVVGEMRELGAESKRYHERVGAAVAASGAAAVIAVGGHAREFVGAAREHNIDATFYGDSQSAVDAVLARVTPGDVVLVKASRGVHAEAIVEALVKQRGRAS